MWLTMNQHSSHPKNGNFDNQPDTIVEDFAFSEGVLSLSYRPT